MTQIEIHGADNLESENTPPPHPTRGGKWIIGILAGILLILAGMTVIFRAAALDTITIAGKPWSTTFILFDIPDELPELESYPIAARRVFRPDSLDDDITLKLLGEIVKEERFKQPLRLSDPELLIAIDLPETEQAPLLASGRLPKPGEAEVLAGSLAHDEPFWIDDVQFTVTGHLANSVSGFLFSYMLPHASDFKHLFVEGPKTASGLLVTSGKILLEADILPDNLSQRENSEEEKEEENEEGEKDDTDENAGMELDETIVVPAYTGGMLLTQPKVTLLTFLGLLIAALGGTLSHLSLFKVLQARRYRPLQAILDMISNRLSLYLGMHALLYGVFFISMYTAITNPLLTYRISQYIQAVFSNGGLGYIGEAYASGDVITAAWATFYNNYIEQTLGLTFLISLFPVPLGLLKTLMSFSLVGGALAPLWAGTAQAYILHSLTMIFELQAYIIACFAITAWPLHLIKGIRQGHFLVSMKSGLVMLFSAALLTGAMLGIAALYEAFTLIHLMTP